jgi:putative PIN family toxin of toxin-antitoxin system
VNPKKDKLRVILDTSVIISANYRSEGFSSPSIIWQAFLNEAFTLVISSQIIEEIISSAIKLNFQIDKIINVIQLINDKAEQIAGDYSTDYLDIIDPKDNMFLALLMNQKLTI